MTTCTKNVNAPCENEATEVLWVRERGPLWDGEWQSKPRCADHPAADDVAMISRMHHWAEAKILPMGAPAPTPRHRGAAMSRLPDTSAEPGPECYCGSELKKVPLPEDLAELAGRESIWVHVHNGDTRCYPEDGDTIATGEPIRAEDTP